MKDLFASTFNCLIWNNNVIGVKTNVKNWNAVLLNQFYIIYIPVMLNELTYWAALVTAILYCMELIYAIGSVLNNDVQVETRR